MCEHAFLLVTRAAHQGCAPSLLYGLSGSSPVGTIMLHAVPPCHPAQGRQELWLMLLLWQSGQPL